MRRILFIALLFLCSWAFAQTPVAPISSIALNQFGQPIPYAQITVCPVTSSGIPCTPLANLYQDYGLTIPLANPFRADQYGNVLAYVPAIAYPNLYVIQISVGQGLYWTYVENGPSGGGGGTGCIPSGSEYDVLTINGSGGCLGAADFQDLTPESGPLEFSGLGLSFSTTDAGTSTNGGEYYLSTTESSTSSDGCPSCFTLNAADNGNNGGGNFNITAYGTNSANTAGGAVTITGSSPAQGSEGEQDSPGSVYIQSLSDMGTDGLPYGSIDLDAETYDALAGSNAFVANIQAGTCDAGNPVGYQSCNITFNANGDPATGGSANVGDINLKASSTGNHASGQINLTTSQDGSGPVDATENSINLIADYGSGYINLDGLVVIPGLGTSTSPPCPNGPGGSLTLTGCIGGGGGIGGSIADNQMAGGTGTNTIGPIPGWDWGTDGGSDLDCGSVSCAIEMVNGTGGSTVLQSGSLNLNNGSGSDILSGNFLEFTDGLTPFSIISFSGLLQLGSGNLTADPSGNLFTSGSVNTPVLRSGLSTNTDLTGRIALSSGSATYSLMASYTDAPNCFVADVTNPGYVPSVSESTTTLTFTGNGSDTVKYQCFGRN